MARARARNVDGDVSSQGYNLIGQWSGSDGWTGPCDIVGPTPSTGLPVNPGLLPLGDYGGPTFTMALSNSSPAIDAGYSFNCSTDQRGLPRPVNLLNQTPPCLGDRSDIGAFELQALSQQPTYSFTPICDIHCLLNSFRLRFSSIGNATISLQSTGDLRTNTWSTLPGSLIGTGGIMEFDITNSPDVAQQFYRVVMSVEPGPSVPYVSFDSTIARVYSNAWVSGSTAGRGFGSWTLTKTSTNLNNDGFFIGSSTNNGNGTNDIDIGGTSWGLYANSANLAVAYRAFSNSLAAGGILGVDMDNGYVNASGTVGFVLRNGNFTSSPTNYTTGARLQFLYIGNDSSNSYKVVDSGGQHNLGVPFTSTGLHLVFTLNNTNTYTLVTIDNASGATNSTLSGTLAGTLGSTVDSIALFNNNAGAGSGNNVYFNSLQTVGP